MRVPSQRLSLPALAWTSGTFLIMIGCREAPRVAQQADTGPLVVDSARVTVVNDTAPVWGDTPQWVVQTTPTLDLGEPATPFLGLAPVLRLSDGRIVVASGATQAIQYFDPFGKLVATAGGRGVEPGQFHGLGWIGRGQADTVIAYDFVAHQLVLFDAKGKFVRAAALVPADPTMSAEPVATYPDGSVLFRLTKPYGPFPGAAGSIVRDSASYLRFDLQGAPVAAIGQFPQGESFGVQTRPKEPLARFPLPFGLTTSAAVRGDSTLIGTGASFEVATFGPEGAPVGVLRAAIERESITPAESQSYTTAAVTRLKTGARMMQTPLDSALIREVEKAPFPSRKPAFGRLLVDRTGALWVSAPLIPPDVPTSWTVFAPDGRWLGTVTTPEGLWVDEIGPDYVLGVWRQRHGQERVRIYALSRGAAS
jgi:hypothetical protein